MDFQSILTEVTGYIFISPENFKLTLIEEEEGVIIHWKYIQIPFKGNIKEVNISIESHDNDIENDAYRYYYNMIVIHIKDNMLIEIIYLMNLLIKIHIIVNWLDYILYVLIII